MKTYNWNKIEERARADMEGLVFDSELHFFDQVEAIAAKIYSSKTYKLVMVAGPSSSGKTTFTRLLSEKLKTFGVNVHLISTDDYFFDRDKVPLLENGIRDFDSLSSMDVDGLMEAIRRISNNEDVDVPEFDFMTGRRKKELNRLKLEDGDIVMIEGIHALNPIFVDIPNDSRVCKISIAPRTSIDFGDGCILHPDELRLIRRCIRDFHTRNHSFISTLRQWEEVRKAEKIYIEPYVDGADFKVDSTYAYELFVYKHCIYKQLEEDIESFGDMLKIFSHVPNLPLAKIPAQSLLNEFAFLPEDSGKCGNIK